MSLNKIYYKLRLIIFYPYYKFKKNIISFNSRICKNVCINSSKIGRYCYIGPNCVLNAVTMGNFCSIAPGVQIGGMEHSYWDVSTSTILSDTCIYKEETIIGHDVWIGANAIIKQGVKIGNGAVIGAGSFVNKDVDSYAIIVGAPGKVFKYRFNKECILEIEKLNYWNNNPSEARKKIKLINIQKYN